MKVLLEEFEVVVENGNEYLTAGNLIINDKGGLNGERTNTERYVYVIDGNHLKRTLNGYTLLDIVFTEDEKALLESFFKRHGIKYEVKESVTENTDKAPFEEYTENLKNVCNELHLELNNVDNNEKCFDMLLSDEELSKIIETLADDKYEDMCDEVEEVAKEENNYELFAQIDGATNTIALTLNYDEFAELPAPKDLPIKEVLDKAIEIVKSYVGM